MKTVFVIINLQTRELFGIFSTKELAEQTKQRLHWLTEGCSIIEIEIDYFVNYGR